MNTETPKGLGSGGQRIWRNITTDYENLDVLQLEILEEACRAKDRCDQIHQTFLDKGIEERGLATKANETSNLLKMLMASLRLPDPVTGRTPQRRSTARAPYDTSKGTKISSLDRAMAKKAS